MGALLCRPEDASFPVNVFPEELWNIIAAQCNFPTQRALQLTCRGMARMVKPHFKPTYAKILAFSARMAQQMCAEFKRTRCGYVWTEAYVFFTPGETHQLRINTAYDNHFRDDGVFIFEDRNMNREPYWSVNNKPFFAPKVVLEAELAKRLARFIYKHGLDHTAPITDYAYLIQDAVD